MNLLLYRHSLNGALLPPTTVWEAIHQVKGHPSPSPPPPKPPRPPLPQPYIKLGTFWGQTNQENSTEAQESTRRNNIDPSPSSHSSAWPYISTDVWYESVDNNRTFFARRWRDFDLSSHNHMMGDSRDWKGWLDQLQWPVTVAISANVDLSWPCIKNNQQKHENTLSGLNASILDHPMLAMLFIMNPRIHHPKVMPLPIGLKWQYEYRGMYSESKANLKTILHSTVKANGPDSSKAMFQNQSRTETVWVRPGKANNKWVQYDPLTNPALSTKRLDLCKILSQSAPRSLQCHGSSNNQNAQEVPTMSAVTLPTEAYYEQLKSHRFVASPPGHGLDTHGTWEALLVGCIPIVPHSPLDPMFEQLPVWLIHSWEEVTDEAVALKAKEMVGRVDEYDWDKVYVSGWIKAMDQAAIEAASAIK
jgi:hypothetical protein